MHVSDSGCTILALMRVYGEEEKVVWRRRLTNVHISNYMLMEEVHVMQSIPEFT